MGSNETITNYYSSPQHQAQLGDDPCQKITEIYKKVTEVTERYNFITEHRNST
jgi:hypothetical protein